MDEPRSLLITGGAGFIGVNFVHYWMDHHPDDRAVVLDALTYAGNPANLEPVKGRPNFRFVRGDICDQEGVATVLRDHAIDVIVHFAAESHVDRSIEGPAPFIRTNVLGTYTLLEAARGYWLEERESAVESPQRSCRFHHVSTDEVYGSLGPSDPPFSETTPYAPNSPYAATKAASDHLVRAYHHTYGLPVTTSNCSNNYGPYQFPEKLIPLMIINGLEGKPLPVYGDGGNVRDWLYVEDHCRGIELVLEKGVVGETYNIGGSSEWANIDLVRFLCSLLDEFFHVDPGLRVRFPHAPAARRERTESLLTFVRDRPGHDWRYAMDISKVDRELSWRPQETFESGLRKTIEWYLKNPEWIASVLSGAYREWIHRHYGRH